MRLDKWFISNLDDSQRQIIIRDPYDFKLTVYNHHCSY